MRGGPLAVLALAVAAISACDDSTDPDASITYRATLSGSAERPNAVTTNGTGTWTGTLNTSTNVLNYTVSYSGMSANTTGAHIHGPASTEQTASVLVNLDQAAQARTITLGTTSGSGTGTVNLTLSAVITATVSGDSLRKLFDSGNAYVNIHTTAYTGGEIRGQITRQ